GGAPAAKLRKAAGSGLLRGTLPLPPRPLFVFFSGTGAAASLRSRPTHPSPGWRELTPQRCCNFNRYETTREHKLTSMYTSTSKHACNVFVKYLN
ncbi:MAG: hypothetical protein NZM35_11975, partial [Chitinophagales bacterium]|nr:hypothetical protein [Chitinophagales bacterium]